MSAVKAGVADQGSGVVVVIPYYNGSEFIERAVRSAMAQTLPPHELIVVDDGSVPEEAERLVQIADRMGFRVIRKENGGQGSARNLGVAESESEFICFLDQDDFFLQNHIEVLREALPTKDLNFGWSYADLCQADRNGFVISENIVKRFAKHPKTNVRDLIAYDMFVLPSASLVARSAFLAIGGFDETLCGYEDDDFFLRMFVAGFSNHFVDRPVTVWCIHEGSTTYGIRMARSRSRYFKKLTIMFPDKPHIGQFHFRDLIVPRFYKHMIPEALAAASGHGGKFATYKTDYVSIAQDFTNTLISNRYVPFRFKMKLRIIMWLLDKPFLRMITGLFSVLRNPHLGWVWLKRRLGFIGS